MKMFYIIYGIVLFCFMYNAMQVVAICILTDINGNVEFMWYNSVFRGSEIP